MHMPFIIYAGSFFTEGTCRVLMMNEISREGLLFVFFIFGPFFTFLIVIWELQFFILFFLHCLQ